jgi:hypothetical protein
LSFVTLIIIEVRNGGVRSLVMRGLDPRIHHFERWIAGSSPAMTTGDGKLPMQNTTTRKPEKVTANRDEKAHRSQHGFGRDPHCNAFDPHWTRRHFKTSHSKPEFNGRGGIAKLHQNACRTPPSRHF